MRRGLDGVFGDWATAGRRFAQMLAGGEEANIVAVAWRVGSRHVGHSPTAQDPSKIIALGRSVSVLRARNVGLQAAADSLLPLV